jgi:hypothetical protein
MPRKGKKEKNTGSVHTIGWAQQLLQWMLPLAGIRAV